MEDWKKIIQEIQVTGLTKKAISDKTKMSPSLVSAIATGARGQNLSWKHGNNLLKLHKSVTRGKR